MSQGKPSGLVKACSMIATLLWAGIFLLLAVLLIPTGALMKSSKHTRTQATATGDCTTEKRKNSTTTKCDVRYAVGDNLYTSAIMVPKELEEGDKVEVYVDTRHPSLALPDDPQKTSTLYITIGVVSLVVFCLSMYAAWKFPTFFCFGGLLRALMPR